MIPHNSFFFGLSLSSFSFVRSCARWFIELIETLTRLAGFSLARGSVAFFYFATLVLDWISLEANSLSLVPSRVILFHNRVERRREKANAAAGGFQVEEKPDVTYNDVGGSKEQIQKLREVVETPLLHPERFVNLGIDPPKGVLVRRPPAVSDSVPSSRSLCCPLFQSRLSLCCCFF